MCFKLSPALSKFLAAAAQTQQNLYILQSESFLLRREEEPHFGAEAEGWWIYITGL